MRPSDPIHIHVGPLRNDAASVGAVEQYVKANGIVAVFLDTFSFFSNVKDENDNAEMIRATKPLLALARDTEAAVLMAHHENKKGGKAGRSIRGASALFAIVDQALMLERQQGGSLNARVLGSLGRYDETPQKLHIELVGYEWRAVDGTSPTDKVLAVLGDKPRTAEEIAKDSGLGERMVRKVLDGIGDRVTRTGQGKKGDPHTYRVRVLPDSAKADSGPPKREVGPETNPSSEGNPNAIPDQDSGHDIGPETNPQPVPSARNAIPDQSPPRGVRKTGKRGRPPLYWRRRVTGSRRAR